tara:strand:- start:150 stop:1406 length:1257 start_codon:yes stop_codon:yes gene_type:complete
MSVNIAIIGLGYVGLPLAVTFSKIKKFKVIGFELDKKKISQLINGKSYIKDISNREVIDLKKRKFTPTNNVKYLNEVKYIIIALPTPITPKKEPNNKYLLEFSKILRKVNLRDKVICLESTVYPSATEQIFLPIIRQQNLKVGKDVYLGYSPERIDPSNKKFKVKNITKIVSGYSNRCLKEVKKLYSHITKTVDASSIICAEFTKCYENVFRSINISFANEMKLLSHKINIDIFEVIKLANTKPFGIFPFFPGPGMGGHCIPVDPFILSWFAKRNNFDAQFIELSGKINDKMPNYVVSRILNHLYKQPNNNKKILILGLSYKKNVGDIRESSSIKVIKLLKKFKFDVYYNDPYIKKMDIENLRIKNSKVDKINLKKFQYVVCLADHDLYNYKDILKHSKFIVDTRNRFPSYNKKIITA